MTNYDKIKKMLEYGGRVKITFSYRWEDAEEIVIFALGDCYLVDIDGFKWHKNILEENVKSIEFIPNPPKMYEVGQKVKYISKNKLAEDRISIIHEVYGDYTYSIDDYDGGDIIFRCDVSHFNLEPVFED